MSDPSLALQGWVYDRLADGSPPIAAQVYDNVPPEPVFPYITIGDSQVLGDDTEDCGDGSEVFIRVHCWSRAVGYPEVKALAAAVRTALKVIPVLADFTVAVAEYLQTQFLRDPDGKTRHAVVEFRYLITHTS